MSLVRRAVFLVLLVPSWMDEPVPTEPAALAPQLSALLARRAFPATAELLGQRLTARQFSAAVDGVFRLLRALDQAERSAAYGAKTAAA